MFHFGFAELVVCVCVVIIAVKPENIPDFLRKMRKFYKKIKGTINEVKGQLHQIERDIQSELDDLDSLETDHKDQKSVEKNTSTGEDKKEKKAEGVMSNDWFN